MGEAAKGPGEEEQQTEKPEEMANKQGGGGFTLIEDGDGTTILGGGALKATIEVLSPQGDQAGEEAKYQGPTGTSGGHCID